MGLSLTLVVLGSILRVGIYLSVERDFVKQDLTFVMTPNLKYLGSIFVAAGYEIRIVGGAVRDLLSGISPKDIDLATTATPTQMIEVFQKSSIPYIETGLQHGTITAVIDHEPFEVTTLRIDTDTDGRHATVEFTKDWKLDAERRDLTYNAMSLGFDGTLYDYFGGAEDLENGVTRFVGDADARIKEDYLRILRYYRFVAKREYSHIDQNISDVIEANAKGLEQISVERIWMELAKILVSPGAGPVLIAMSFTGVASAIGIKLMDMPAFLQIDSYEPVTKLTALMGVEVVPYTHRLKMSSHETKLAEFLVRHWDVPPSDKMFEAMVANGVSPIYARELSNLQQFDASEAINKAAAAVFPVTGQDLLDLGYQPGPEVGKRLKRMKAAWIESRLTMTKEQLMEIDTST